MKIVLSCGGPKCCPEVNISETEDKVTITDDFGGKVHLTKAQYEMLKKC